jgi:hypothetical protein
MEQLTTTSAHTTKSKAEMSGSKSAGVDFQTKFKTTMEDSNEASPTASSMVRRHPAQVKVFWDDVRAKLWIPDEEITSSKTKSVAKKPKMFNGGKKKLASRLESYDTCQTEMLIDKSQISMMPSAERR